jgi:tRNA(Arg) A34 adenosine deaminase TadA
MWTLNAINDAISLLRALLSLTSLKMSAQDAGFKAAVHEARQGSSEGGVPIGACLVSAEGKILGQGHNMRIQKGSATLHVSVALNMLAYNFMLTESG